jgi:hypothetical protein
VAEIDDYLNLSIENGERAAVMSKSPDPQHAEEFQ